MRRRLVPALGALLVLTGLAAVTGPALARPSGTEGTLGTYASLSPTLATDGHGYALAAWSELDKAYPAGEDFSGKWRITVADRLPNSASWETPHVVSDFGAVPGARATPQEADPPVAAGLAPSGAAVVAWVQKVGGGIRVQVATRSSRGAAFSAPVTLPTQVQCTPTTTGVERLDVAFDDAGGHVMYLNRCSGGPGYRNFVPVSGTGSVGTPYPAGIDSSVQADLVRLDGTTRWVYVAQSSGSLVASTLDSSGVVTTSTLATSTQGVSDRQLRSTTNGTAIVSVFRGSDAGTMKAAVSSYTGTADEDVTFFDPVTDSGPQTPAVGVSPNGTLAAAWIEGGKLWATIRAPGGVWSTPAVVNNVSDHALLGDSARVVATDAMVHVVWNTQWTTAQGLNTEVFSAYADPTVPGAAFSAPQETLGGTYTSVVALPNGGARVVAPYVAPLIGTLVWRDLVTDAKVAPSITAAPLSSRAGTGGPLTVTLSAGGAPVPRAQVILTGLTPAQSGTTDEAGRLVFEVPGDLPVGPHELLVTFLGNADVLGGSWPLAYTVTPGAAPAKQTVDLKVKSKPRPTSTKPGALSVVASGTPSPTGKVTAKLKLGAKKVKSKATLKHGKVLLELPKLAPGTWQVTVSYAGDDTFEAAEKTLKLKVT